MDKYVVFNRNEFKWAEEFYDIIQKKMDLPDWFGKNLDALWDMLIGYIDLPCEITFIGFNKKENHFNKEILTKIIDCFLDAQKEYPNEIIVKIKDN